MHKIGAQIKRESQESPLIIYIEEEEKEGEEVYNSIQNIGFVLVYLFIDVLLYFFKTFLRNLCNVPT